MGNHIANIATSFFIVVLATTLVLPGRQTPGVIAASGSALSGVTLAALGIGTPPKA